MSVSTEPKLVSGDLAPFDPSIEPVIRSVNGDTSTHVTFVNLRPTAVHLYWRDYNGKRVSYGVIAGKGGTRDQQTYITHPWVVVDEETQVAISVWNPTSWNSRAVIR